MSLGKKLIRSEKAKLNEARQKLEHIQRLQDNSSDKRALQSAVKHARDAVDLRVQNIRGLGGDC